MLILRICCLQPARPRPNRAFNRIGPRANARRRPGQTDYSSRRVAKYFPGPIETLTLTCLPTVMKALSVIPNWHARQERRPLLASGTMSHGREDAAASHRQDDCFHRFAAVSDQAPFAAGGTLRG